VVGLGMAKQTGVAREMFRALADANVNILMITTSEIKISVLVDRNEAVAALRTVHTAFGLDKEPVHAGENGHNLAAVAHHASDAVAVVARLQKMEELTIDDIALDETQARLTVSGVADTPGIAAAIFDAVADGGIFVDMIVQSYGRQGKAKLSFTVPQDQYKQCLDLLNGLASRLRCGPITGSPKVAKLSVSGIGMRSHTEVAIRTFRCLAEAGINVDMINTSEVRVNVVVEGQHGRKALDSLQKAFADARQ
jgi:aspartate kinase